MPPARNGLLAAATTNINQAPVLGPVSCVTINSTESIWGTNGLGNTSANPGVCGNNIPAAVQDLVCGLYSRMDLSLSPPDACTTAVTDASTIGGRRYKRIRTSPIPAAITPPMPATDAA